MLAATAKDLAVFLPPGKAIIKFDSKSGTRLGFNEAKIITDVSLVRLIAAVKTSMLDGDKFINMSPIAFRNLLAQAISYIGLDPREYKGYSIRRGGATHDFRVHGDFAKTQNRGGWSNARTARIYINDSLAHVKELSESPLSADRINKLIRSFNALLT